MNWSSFLSAFGLIFIAELGDKTQLAVITQTCKFQTPWPVFAGGSLALTLVTAIGVVGGQLLGAVIPTYVIRYLAALAFVVIGALVWRETLTMSEEKRAMLNTSDCEVRSRRWNWQAFGATFSLLFLTELGDKTQLAAMSLASQMPRPWIVFAGGAAALTAITALGVICGQQLSKWIPEHILLRISAAAFIIMGLLIALGIAAP